MGEQREEGERAESSVRRLSLPFSLHSGLLMENGKEGKRYGVWVVVRGTSAVAIDDDIGVLVVDDGMQCCICCSADGADCCQQATAVDCERRRKEAKESSVNYFAAE